MKNNLSGVLKRGNGQQKNMAKSLIDAINELLKGYSIDEIFSPHDTVKNLAIEYFTFCSEFLSLNHTTFYFTEEEFNLLKLNDIIVNNKTILN